MVTMAIPANSL